MCTPYVTTPNNLHAARSIENTYPLLPNDNPDSGVVAVAVTGETSSKVSGSWPSVRSAPFGATYTSYHSARHRFPPITPANAQPTPSPALASARQRSRVSARAVVRAAGDPCASICANATYGGGASVLLLEAEVGMSHAGRWPLALRQALSARSAATTGGRRRPMAGRVSGARRKGTRGSWERWGRKLSQASSTLIKLSCAVMVAVGDDFGPVQAIGESARVEKRGTHWEPALSSL